MINLENHENSTSNTTASRVLKKGIKLASFLSLVLLAAACATPLTPTQSARGPSLPNAGPDKEYKVKFPDPGRGKARYIVLTIGGDLAATCGKWKTPHFEFDSAEPLPEDQLMLRDLAECLNQPTILAHDVMVKGNTDDHGSATYNQALGLRRAERVKEILVANGVAAARIQTSSSGERAAVAGENPQQYAEGYDRRVDIALLNVVHAPARGNAP